MSLQRDLFLMTPGTSVRTVQKYTSDIVSQWKSQMSACHMEKLRFGRAHDLCISSIATYWCAARNLEVGIIFKDRRNGPI